MSGARREWSFALLMGSSHGAQHFFKSLLPPLIPVLAVVLELPLWRLGLLVSVFSVGSGIGQTAFGILSDRYDRRYLLPTGLAMLAGGYVVFGSAPGIGGVLPHVEVAGIAVTGTYLVMVATMLVCGLGSSVTHPTGYPMISANMSDSRKGRALGIWGSASTLGNALAPAVVGLLILVTAWDRMLVLFGVVGLAYAGALFVVLGRIDAETRPAAEVRGDADGSASPWTDDRRLFVYPMLVIVLFFAVRQIATQGVTTFVPVFVTDTYGFTISALGIHFEPASVANFYFATLLVFSAAVQLVAGALTDRFDHRAVVVTFLVLGAAALAVLSFLRLGPATLLLALLAAGGGLWGINPGRDALVSDISPAAYEGRTFGYLWTLAQLTGALSPVVIGYLADLTGIQDSFRYLALAALVAGGLIALLFSDRIYVPREPEPAAATD